MRLAKYILSKMASDVRDVYRCSIGDHLIYILFIGIYGFTAFYLTGPFKEFVDSLQAYPSVKAIIMVAYLAIVWVLLPIWTLGSIQAAKARIKQENTEMIRSLRGDNQMTDEEAVSELAKQKQKQMQRSTAGRYTKTNGHRETL